MVNPAELRQQLEQQADAAEQGGDQVAGERLRFHGGMPLPLVQQPPYPACVPSLPPPAIQRASWC